MSDYNDLQLINCNRSASVEARTLNNSNPAIFTNPLQQAVRLDVGDQVSLERSFISEIGAGNPSTIEFKGASKGTNVVPTYTDIVYGDYFYEKSTTYDANYRVGYYRTIKTTEVSGETIPLQDNVAPITVGYYITSNEYPNYVHQPRRFLQPQDTRGSIPTNPTMYVSYDGETQGFCYYTINTQCVCDADWIKRTDYAANPIYKQRVDNTRFTLFIKDNITYSGAFTGVNGAKRQFPTVNIDGIFSEATYYRIRDKIDINIDKGFNTPSDVADQITQTLSETQTPETFEILDGDNYLRTITHTTQSRTYKPINAQNIYNTNSATFTSYIAGIPVHEPSQAQIDYIATYGYIGVKRPEIFEAGREMHTKINPGTDYLYRNGDPPIEETPGFLDDFDGFCIFQNIVSEDKPPTENVGPAQGGKYCVLNVRYNEENLGYIRDFLDTQKLYPELWDNLQDTTNYGTPNEEVGVEFPTATNSRFFHINKYSPLADPPVVPHNGAFGDDGYIEGAGGENVNKATAPIFLEWDEDSRDYYRKPEEYIQDIDPLVYGFAEPFLTNNYLVKDIPIPTYLIMLRVGTRGGIPYTLFTDTDTVDDFIYKRRRIGFDYHATAYSTAIVTPFSGYSNADIGTLVKHVVSSGPTVTATETFSDTSNLMKDTINVTTTDLSPYMTQSYIGANTPTINFNTITNRFEFQKFHTSNNVGNLGMAGNSLDSITNASLYPPHALNERLMKPPDINSDAGDTVYKINPRPPQFGYSPTFKPYNNKNQSYRIGVYPEAPNDAHTNIAQGPNTNFYEIQNLNIDPFAVFDAHGGIYIDNWGYSEANWSDNLWDILGFSYSQLNAPPTDANVLNQRVNNDNISSLYRLTTNAEIVATDSKAYISNNFGANMYYTSLPYPRNILTYDTAVTVGSERNFSLATNHGTPLTFYPETVIKTQSIGVQADNLSKSVLRPYYTIRSSILEGATAIGGNPTGANLPIISIVDKYSAQGDYFFGTPSDLVFTVTKPTIVSDITTSIHDPDGTYANTDETSSVIYKISKLKKAPEDIISQILKKKK